MIEVLTDTLVTFLLFICEQCGALGQMGNLKAKSGSFPSLSLNDGTSARPLLGIHKSDCVTSGQFMKASLG